MKRGDTLITLVATGFYTGYFPFAPATFSTLTAGIVLYLLVAQFSPLWYGIITLLVLFGAIRIADRAEKLFQRQDCPAIVIDELVGFLITMFLVPCTWHYIAGGFIIFRIFDILKPPPANLFNRRKHGGLDIVMDDVAAGIYANLLLHLVHYYLIPG